MDTRLLFKQKDFESDYAKRRSVAKVTVGGHPLKPNKKGAKKEIIVDLTGKQNNPLAKLLPHQRVQLPVQQNQPVVPTAQPQANASTIGSQIVPHPSDSSKQDGKKIVFGNNSPWSAIRGQFIRVYDTRKERTDLFVANPFGSMGLRRQEQMREKYGNQWEQPPAKHIAIKTYLAILEEMRRDLKKKWDDQDKVGTLQIAIQATKLLHDTEKTKFQALKFAYVIDIVEQFGLFVYERIKSLSFPTYTEARLRDTTLHQLEGSNIAESAQEICRNWLLKIGSIRELMPRAIIETTLLRLYFFLDGGRKVKQVLTRLARTNRGFGQYLNSIFFSTFLVRIGHEVLPKEKGFILDILDDVFFYIKQGKTKFNRPDLSHDEFFELLEPFFKSAFESLGESLDESDFRRFTKSLPQNPHPVILRNLIKSFSDELLATCSTDLTKMLQKVYGDQKYPLYKMMLSRLTNVRFPQSKQLIILSWTDLNEIAELRTFLDLLAPFVEIIFRNVEGPAKSQIFSMILEKFNALFSNFRNPKEQDFFSRFEQFLATLLQNTENSSEILTIEPFLQIISYFPRSVKVQICSKITGRFLEKEETVLQDPVVVNTMLTLLKNLQGQADAGPLVLTFLKKVDFRNDLEGMLNFYGQVRATFGYLTPVTRDLISRAIRLTLRARKLTRSRSKKIVGFLQACIAYCYITIPLIESTLERIKLYLHVSQVALTLNLISQSNSLLKQSISQLLELQNDAGRDQQISRILQQIVGFLFVMPDDPENEFLFLFNGLMNAFEMIKFTDKTASVYRLRFYSQCLTYLNAQVQERLPFHIEGVDSNDFLFKTKDFRKAVLDKLLELFGKLEETVAAIEKAPVNDTESDKLLFGAMLHSMGMILNTLQCTQRSEALLIRLADQLAKCSQRLLKDRSIKHLVTDKKTLIKCLQQQLEEEEYSKVKLSIKL